MLGLKLNHVSKRGHRWPSAAKWTPLPFLWCLRYAMKQVGMRSLWLIEKTLSKVIQIECQCWLIIDISYVIHVHFTNGGIFNVMDHNCTAVLVNKMSSEQNKTTGGHVWIKMFKFRQKYHLRRSNWQCVGFGSSKARHWTGDNPLSESSIA